MTCYSNRTLVVAALQGSSGLRNSFNVTNPCQLLDHDACTLPQSLCCCDPDSVKLAAVTECRQAQGLYMLLHITCYAFPQASS